MCKIDDGGQAFPGMRRVKTDGGSFDVPANGMTLRDYFAAQAMVGMQARDTYDDGQATPAQRARLAYIEADAMLAAR